MLRLLVPIYHSVCPNCGGPVDSGRLERGLPCKRCLPDEALTKLGNVEDTDKLHAAVGELLKARGTLKGYWYLYTSSKQIADFESFFVKLTGSPLWSAQKTWAKRLLQMENLAIVAPTGVGKTTLLLAYGLYRAREGARVYHLLPTENLVIQVLKKLTSMARRVLPGLRIVSYYASMPRRLKEEALSRISKGDFDVLVTTTSFLSRRWELLNGLKFDLVIVDDVDAVLRNSRNIDRILQLLGFSIDAVDAAYRLVKKRIAALVAKVSGNVKLYERILHEIKELEAKISSELASSSPGQLVIASATGRSYGLKPKMLRELLGLDIGRVYDYTRSIVNFYDVVENDEELVNRAVHLVKMLGSGGLIFVSRRYGKHLARLLVRKLQEHGIKSALALSGRKVLDRFEAGEYDVLVGMASYYGVIVRGVDMPARIVYTVFVGVPSNSMDLETALASPHRIARIAFELGLEGSERLVKTVSNLSPGEALALRISLLNGTRPEGSRLSEIFNELEEARRAIVKVLRERLAESGKLVVGGMYVARREHGSEVAIVVDAPTYVQASGRASRMYGSRMTHGISIVLETDEALVNLLSARLRKYVENASFERLGTNRLMEEWQRAVRSRVSMDGGRAVNVETCLIVVESPTKAKTIAKFFGKPVRRKVGSLPVYEVTFYNKLTGTVHVASIAASVGHIYDLSLDDEGVYGIVVESKRVSPIYKPIKRCLDCGFQYPSSGEVCPRCGSANYSSKLDVINALRQLASEVDTVYIATDPDMEGEKIAYDIYLTLKPYARKIKRIELHEVTVAGLFRGLAKPRDIDVNLARAQVVRRIEDRWIGFALSQHLWEEFGMRWLGAGRVQTPVLGWIAQRYREWRENAGYVVYLKFEEIPPLRLYFRVLGDARKFVEHASRGLVVSKISYMEQHISPPPPFTTEQLIGEASKLYGYTAEKTMKIAQQLFEAGLITYHRTDSTHVSATGIGVAKGYLDTIGLGEEFVPRGWGPEGHHEAIRPTKPIDASTLRKMVALGDLRLPIPLRESHYRLYDLIFRRFIASQMRPATVARVRLVLEEPTTGIQLEVEGVADYVEPGYLQVYQHPRLYKGLSSLKPGEKIVPLNVVVRRGSKIALYTHGDVVLLMKNRGIGRPSTYARIMEALKRHGYVIESKYRKKLIPTKIGLRVYEYLSTNFSQLVSESRTKALLSKIDMVAQGRADPVQLIFELAQELSASLQTNYLLKKAVDVFAYSEQEGSIL
jgi:reverse gyrase